MFPLATIEASGGHPPDAEERVRLGDGRPPAAKPALMARRQMRQRRPRLSLSIFHFRQNVGRRQKCEALQILQNVHQVNAGIAGNVGKRPARNAGRPQTAVERTHALVVMLVRQDVIPSLDPGDTTIALAAGFAEHAPEADSRLGFRDEQGAKLQSVAEHQRTVCDVQIDRAVAGKAIQCIQAHVRRRIRSGKLVHGLTIERSGQRLAFHLQEKRCQALDPCCRFQQGIRQSPSRISRPLAHHHFMRRLDEQLERESVVCRRLTQDLRVHAGRLLRKLPRDLAEILACTMHVSIQPSLHVTALHVRDGHGLTPLADFGSPEHDRKKGAHAECSRGAAYMQRP
jgi:hypothetical protein